MSKEDRAMTIKSLKPIIAKRKRLPDTVIEEFREVVGQYSHPAVSSDPRFSPEEVEPLLDEIEGQRTDLKDLLIRLDHLLMVVDICNKTMGSKFVANVMKEAQERFKETPR